MPNKRAMHTLLKKYPPGDYRKGLVWYQKMINRKFMVAQGARGYQIGSLMDFKAGSPMDKSIRPPELKDKDVAKGMKSAPKGHSENINLFIRGQQGLNRPDILPIG